MRKAVIALSLSTALFAASTLYFAYRLYVRESGPIATSATTSPPISGVNPEPSRGPAGPDVRPTTASSAPGAPIDASSAAGVAAAPARPASVDSERESMIGFAKQWLAKADDPEQRTALLDEIRGRLRRQYEVLRKRLNLDAATFDQLLTVLAELEMAPTETYFRCVADPSCDLKKQHATPFDDRSAELNALLGDKMDEFTRYRNSIGERASVEVLRGRLNESDAMRDEQVESLVTALNDEHMRYANELTQRGAALTGWGTPNGMLWFPGDSPSVQQRLADAAAYSQRLRQRAAAVLSPQQLAVFVQLQEELLAAMRSTMRSPG